MKMETNKKAIILISAFILLLVFSIMNEYVTRVEYIGFIKALFVPQFFVGVAIGLLFIALKLRTKVQVFFFSANIHTVGDFNL